MYYVKLIPTQYFFHSCVAISVEDSMLYLRDGNGEHSKRCHVLSGVPQGSVLGPLLLLIYINSLTFIVLSDSTRLILYGDDLFIYKPIPTETSHLQLQSDINSISLWADNNLMTFNEAKCKCMLLTNKK